MKTILKRILRSQGGFTLIELLAVLAIISVLAGIVTAAVSGTKGASTESQVQSDAQSTQTATDNFKTADISGKAVAFPDKPLTDSRLRQVSGTDVVGEVNNIYNDVFTVNGEQGTNVLLVSQKTPGIRTAETLGDKIIPSGQTTAAQFLFNGIDFTPTAGVKTRNAAGDVITSTFVPDFLPKSPSSLVLKGDETANLGTGKEGETTRSGNTYEEFLWVYRSLGSGGNQSRSVEVYRLSTARCSTANISADARVSTDAGVTISGASSADPVSHVSDADFGNNNLTANVAKKISARVQTNSDNPLSAYTTSEVTTALAKGSPCDTTNSTTVLLVYDRVF